MAPREEIYFQIPGGCPQKFFARGNYGTVDLSHFNLTKICLEGGAGLVDDNTCITADTAAELKTDLGKGDSAANPIAVTGTPQPSVSPAAPAIARVDKTQQIRKAIVEQRMELCNLQEVASVLKTPVNHQFPVTPEMWYCLPSLNRAILFRLAGPDEDCYGIAYLVKAIVDPPLPSSTIDTEDAYHHFWDTVIDDTLRFFFDGPWLPERNTSGEGSTSGTGPDKVVRFGFHRYALWRGEEKGPATTGDPRGELLSKLVWTYRQLPFLMAYYAQACDVTFCALHMQGSLPDCQDVLSFNLGSAEGRLDLVFACINLARLLLAMRMVCEGANEVSDMPVIERASGKVIRPFGRKVEKTYTDAAVFYRVVSLYREIQECAHVERIIHTRENDRTMVVQRALGATPKNSLELYDCLRCLSRALECLHAKGFMHRDIRWDNVLRDWENKDRWVLIDFDEAARSPCKVPHLLDITSHAPEMSCGLHNEKVDIWSVGYLLSTSNILLDDTLVALRQECLQLDPEDRPTAHRCLQLLSS